MKIFRCPRPLPPPQITTQFSPEDVDESILTILKHLGYADDNEIFEELGSPYPSPAKSFYIILTSKLNVLSLPWDNQIELSEDAIMMSPKMQMPQSLTIQGRDQFFRRKQMPNPGSPDLYSFTGTMMPQYQFDSGEQTINQLPSIDTSLDQVTTAVIESLESENYLFFYPNDFCLIVRGIDGAVYSLIEFQLGDAAVTEFSQRLPITIKFQFLGGDLLSFSHLIDIVANGIQTL